MRVADYLLARLAEEGVSTVFGLTGGGIMHLIDAVAKSEKVKFQPVHHEEFAGICADGYARSGKKFGVAFATTGPGAAHLFTAAAAAWQDSVPTLLIVGQVKTSDSSRLRGLKVRQYGTFELDSIDSFSYVTKKAILVDSAESAIKAIEEAILLCQMNRPGPVLIEIPLDVQAMKVSATRESAQKYEIEPSMDFSTNLQDFKNVIRIELESARRPVLLFGAGVVRAQAEPLLRELNRIAQIPYVVTQFARNLGDSEDLFFLGSPGVKPNRSANMILAEADLLIAVGTSLHQQVIGWSEEKFINLKSKKIWAELDGHILESRKKLVNHAFQLEATKAISTLIECFKNIEFQNSSLNEWREKAQLLKKNFLLFYPNQEEEADRFSLYKAISIFSARARRYKAVVTDAGLLWYVVAQHYFPARNSFYISSGSFGSMGMALPLAIGSASATQMPTLCFTGDGSLMTCLQELATLASSQLPILLVVNSNDGYLSIKTTHNKFFDGRKIGTDSSNGVVIPSIQGIANLFGIEYLCAKTENELELILDSESCCDIKRPLIIEVRTLTNQKVEPVIVSNFNNENNLFESGSLLDLYPPLEELVDFDV